MVVSTRAIVLSALKYSEADLIVTCFTEDFGIQSYMLRSVLKSKKGKLRASYFLPLTKLEMEATHKNKGTLESIKEVRVLDPYQTLHTDVVKSSMVLFIAEMLKNCIKEEEANLSLFEYIENAMIWLDGNASIANFHILFLLKLATHLGFYPDTSELTNEYFNLVDGSFQNHKSNNYCERGEAVDALKQFFGINFDTIENVKLTKTARLATLNLLLTYYQLHLQGYKKPKSLSVLHQLFN